MNNQNNYPKNLNYATQQQLFLAYLTHYNGAFTYCCEIQGWMQHEKSLRLAKSVRDLKQRMALNPDYEDRHFHKVDTAYEHFKKRFKQAGLQMPASADEVP